MINLPLATESWDKDEYKAIERVIKSNFFTMGKEVSYFESDFARYFGAKYAVMVNSGSSANLLAISALIFSKRYDLNSGDEIIVPAVSWATTFAPLQQHNLKVKFVDIDLETLNFDLEKLKKAISSRTKAIFAVNLLGNSNEYNEILDICEKQKIILIEDNCEAMGAKYDNKYLGTIGVLGTFSTFFSHHISTMEGGVVVTNDEELKDIMLSIRAHGWTRNLGKDSSIYSKSNDEFYETFNFILPGYNLRPLEIEGALGKEQLKKLPKLIEARRENARYFNKIFSQLKSVMIQKEIGESSYFGFSLIIRKDSKYSREELVKQLKIKNVECRPIVAGNFTKNPVIKYFDYEIDGDLENADYLHNNGLFIGNHHYDCKSKLEAVYKLIMEMER
jgi:CDP-6-deoxy-D-xylo-4-hexulose-3-dehydrase